MISSLKRFLLSSALGAIVNLALLAPTLVFAEDKFPVTVIDSAGKKITLESAPKRIAVIGKTYFASLHLVYMFPEGARALVGFERRGGGEDAFLPMIDKDHQSRIKLAQEPGPEQILALKPDLIVTKGKSPGPIYRMMSSLNIPVLHVGLENPEEFLRDVENLGAILGARERSQEIISFYAERLKMISDRVSTIPPDKKPEVLAFRYDQRSGVASVQVPSRSWIQTIQVERGGGNPVWLSELGMSNNWQVVGFEQIANWNPDKMIAVIWFKLHGPTVLKKLKTDAKWRLLKAVKTNELYQYPEDVYGWDTPDPRWILGMQWMAKVTHPDLFRDMDMNEEVTLFFSEMFGMEKSAVKGQILPLLSTTLIVE